MLPVNEMAEIGNSVNVQEYGTVVDKGRVACSYCGKVVRYFSRLKYHLAGIPKNVAPCPIVPLNIRALFMNEIENTGSVVKVEITTGQPDSRGYSPCKNTLNSVAKTSVLGSKKRGRKRGKVDCISGRRPREFIPCPDSSDVAPGGRGDLSLKELRKSIVRFFCETGLDFRAANSHSFGKIIETALHHGQLQKDVPDLQVLNLDLNRDALEEMKQYVKEIRSSWASTGCSILLDGWKDSKDRDLVNVLVDCPSGAIYLRSVDLSSLVGDANAMQGLLEEILEDVGLGNVVQIITDSIPASMQEVGKELMKKHKTWYWTVCTSSCLEIMLDKFSTLSSFRDTLGKAKTISRFIYSHDEVLKLLGYDACLTDLVHVSKIRSITTFCTVENILCKEKDLRNFFVSCDWNISDVASTEDGRRVTGLVSDENFWTALDTIVKSAIPLVRVLETFSSDISPQIGLVYEIMDQAKEEIRKGFKGKKHQYKPFWDIIDEIWDNYLYTPLQSAGYFLSPRLFYSEDFHLDPEVTTGLLHCVTRMGGSINTLALVVDQIDEYRMARGKFAPGSARKELLNLSSPENWWSKYGGHCPELQKFAIKILSQTCNGGSKYSLKKTPAEMIFERGTNPVEQRLLSEQAFIYYNMHLQDFAPDAGNGYMSDGELDPKNDWIMEKAPFPVPKNENSVVIYDERLIDVPISFPMQVGETKGVEGPNVHHKGIHI